jgi:hypothetical protein
MTAVRQLVLATTASAAGLWLGYTYAVKRPSNDRDWEYGMATLAGVSVDGNTVHIANVRDYAWGPDGPRSSDYVSRTYDVTHLSRVWFVKEPFPLIPQVDFGFVAHTYFMFDFDNQPPVGLSVEARRERGETFDGFHGIVNDFELIYIWGTERDLTASRAVREGHGLNMYPLTVPDEAARRLFLHLADVTQRLATQPRFYNTLTSNCTNELAKVANSVEPNAIPLNIGLILPGFADTELYNLGFLSHTLPLETLRERASISDFVRANYERDDLSTLLRTELSARQVG